MLGCYPLPAMRTHLVLFLALLIRLAPLQGADSAPPAQVDVDYNAVWAIYNEQHPDPELRKHDPKAWFRFYDARMRKFSEAAWAFAAKYPTEPRRYEALIQSSYTRPYFLTGFKPEFDAAPRDTNLIVDEPALLAFWGRQLKILAEVVETPEATTRERGGAMVAYLVDSRAQARVKGMSFDVESAGPLVERALAKAANETILAVLQVYLDALRQADRTDAARALEAKVQANSTVAPLYAAQQAKRAAADAERARKLTALAALKFTAVDGREVEVAKLRGKVVLIDFWATWCGPCVAELPNVRKVYAAYHEKGFEVIGISLENPNARPGDTPDQTAEKLTAAKKKLVDFVTKNEMPWPQYFDGKWWKNDYATQFGVASIPAMFLLDKNGNIASQEARGPKLEAEVKRLLGL